MLNVTILPNEKVGIFPYLWDLLFALRHIWQQGDGWESLTST